MAESILVDINAPKALKYEQLIPQIKALVGEEDDAIAVMANAAAAIHNAFGFLWTGFYIVQGNELVLGPFQGPIACMRIAHGKGVCGAAWEHNKSIVVLDVNQFPGHIACSSESRSEIVIPLKNSSGAVEAIFDADSSAVGTFDSTDREYLETLCNWLSERIF